MIGLVCRINDRPPIHTSGGESTWPPPTLGQGLVDTLGPQGHPVGASAWIASWKLLAWRMAQDSNSLIPARRRRADGSVDSPYLRALHGAAAWLFAMAFWPSVRA